jgi:hypothetical protein
MKTTITAAMPKPTFAQNEGGMAFSLSSVVEVTANRIGSCTIFAPNL